MRYFRRISLIILVASISLIIMYKYSSPDGKIIVKDIVISKKNNINNVDFKQEINFDYLIVNAINKGIPLVFKVTLGIAERNEFWPTKIIKKEIRYYQIEYKALRKIYKITDINGKKYEYKNIIDAVKKLSFVEGLQFTIVKNVNKDHELWLRVTLDKKKLPKPLQVNYFDTTWDMSSKKTIHKLGKLN